MSHNDQRRRRVLRAVAPVAGLLAVGLLVWQGSYAAFSATTNNTGDVWTAGGLTLTNDNGAGTGAAGTFSANTTLLFNQSPIKPGSTASKCITIKAGGTQGGTLKFYRSTAFGAGTSTALASQLQLNVVTAAVTATAPVVAPDCTTGFTGTNTISSTSPQTTVFSLPVTYPTGLGSIVVPSGTQYVTYKIQYTFASTGSDAGDNLLQNATVIADLNWEMQ